MFQGIWVLSVYSCTLVLEVVSGDVHRGHLETVVDECCLDAVVAFLNSGVGQSCQVELHATRHAHLDGNRSHLQAVDSSTKGLYKHSIYSFLQRYA